MRSQGWCNHGTLPLLFLCLRNVCLLPSQLTAPGAVCPAQWERSRVQRYCYMNNSHCHTSRRVITKWSKHLILGFGTTSVWFYKCVLWCQMYMAITGTLDILKWSWFCFWQFLSAYVGLGAEYFMIISGTSGLRGLHMETCPCNQIYSWHNYQNSLFTHPS